MIAQHPTTNVAHSQDIPGSRTGPEDGWPRTYQLLSDAEIWAEMARLAVPKRTIFDVAKGWRADALNFQPCATSRTQDRYVVQQLDIHGRMWTLTGVFDGHLGDATVEHTAYHMPIIIKDFLLEAFKDNPHRSVTPKFIADILSRSITSFDEAIAGDVLKMFPGGMDALRKMSNQEIRTVIHDQANGGLNFQKTKLCMYGTTALVALTDPEHHNVWVANLGDCQAVLVSKGYLDEWKIERLTNVHNGDNDSEVARVRREHPGESESVVDRRVLGALAPFRCIGDVPFKQPPEFTRRILYNLYPGFHDTSPWEEFLVRNCTPPYISSQPEITHRSLRSPAPSSSRPALRFLVLASDGFTDLCDMLGDANVVGQWARAIAERTGNSGARSGVTENLALSLLWHALGGEDRARVSRVLTLDTDTPWVDDTAIVVQTL